MVINAGPLGSPAGDAAGALGAPPAFGALAAQRAVAALGCRILRFHCSPCRGARTALSRWICSGARNARYNLHQYTRSRRGSRGRATRDRRQGAGGCPLPVGPCAYGLLRRAIRTCEKRRERLTAFDGRGSPPAEHGFRPRLAERGTTPHYCANSAALSVGDVCHDPCGSRLCAGGRDGGPMSYARRVAHRPLGLTQMPTGGSLAYAQNGDTDNAGNWEIVHVASQRPHRKAEPNVADPTCAHGVAQYSGFGCRSQQGRRAQQVFINLWRTDRDNAHWNFVALTVEPGDPVMRQTGVGNERLGLPARIGAAISQIGEGWQAALAANCQLAWLIRLVEVALGRYFCRL